ncbi:MAG: nucleotidyltransferase domain-containing protein, partial [Candidatus Levybacteria bacterium]|nr:nucleotidyltransferase domain-containing protein [Candidatus Levybacteria bacterium]
QKLDKKLVVQILRLLKRKKAGEELDTGERIEIINSFLEDRLRYFEEYTKTVKKEKSMRDEALDSLFRDILKEQWANNFAA